MARVLIVAPTPALRAGLRALLAESEVNVAGEASELAGACFDHADVVVVGDPELLRDANALLGSIERPGILLLANDERLAGVLRGLPVSGWGIVLPDASASEIQSAILAIAQGLVVLAPALAERSVSQRTAPALADQQVEQLTGRELEVLGLISQGLSNRQIAQKLQISEHTVKFHVSAIFTKLGATSRTDAISRAARQGLIIL